MSPPDSASAPLLLGGVDEAGYGPLLGPLVVALAALPLEEEGGGEEGDLWARLAKIVCRRGRREGRLRVDDSKKVLAAPGGTRILEETVLAFLGVGGETILAALEERFALAAAAGEAPWERPAELRLPRAGAALDGRAAALAAGLRAAGVGAAFCRWRALQPGEYNRGIGQTGNKGALLFREAAALARELLETHPGFRVRLFFDKQGGRDRYGDFLARSFPAWGVCPLSEGRELSRYRLGRPGRPPAEFVFAPRADQTRLPVALASMVAKYLRECWLALFNRFWLERRPGLAPTAGYWTDGQRFLAEIGDDLARLKIPRELVVRCR